MRSVVSAVAFGLLSVSPLLASSRAVAQDAQRVYVVIADSVPLSVPAAATALTGALTRQG